MRIALNHGALGFGADLVAAPLAPGDKELLLRGKAIDDRSGVLLPRFFEGQVSDSGARQVANALTHHQLAVVMDAGLDEVAIELAHHAGGAVMEAIQVVRGPPVVEAALGIVLSALIVKAVADLMADDDADPAIIDGIRVIHAERGRLKNAGWKNNFIEQRIVIGVGGGRR